MSKRKLPVVSDTSEPKTLMAEVLPRPESAGATSPRARTVRHVQRLLAVAAVATGLATTTTIRSQAADAGADADVDADTDADTDADADEAEAGDATNEQIRRNPGYDPPGNPNPGYDPAGGSPGYDPAPKPACGCTIPGKK